MVRLLGYFCCALFLLITSLSCDSSEPPPIVPPPPDLRKITLSVEDVSCTEVWLNIKADSLTFPSEIILLKDTVTQTINLCCSDTTLYIDSLLPNKPYNYKAILTADTTIKSETLTAQTLDTTSHNFFWQSWEFGEHSSSVLYDVAIIDENNIWAVGEIYMNDSLGNPDPHAYNAAHWDGSQWELKKIMFPTVCGSVNRTSYPAKSIFAFQDGEIWIGSSGDKIAILENGVQVSEFCLPSSLNMGINKIWGTSSEDLYVVGNGGNIAHYENGVWTKIESGTESNINDIWGDMLETTGEKKILCAVSNIDGSGENKILQIMNDDNIAELYWPADSCNTGCIVYSLWFRKKSKLYACGDGIWVMEKEGDWKEQQGFLPYFKGSIRGNDVNDIICVGAFGFAAHYNGVQWTQLTEVPYSDVLGEATIKEGLLVIAGFSGSKAKITLGKR
ncbi:MAG: glucosyl transferase [Ignavibacteriales bacterium]|nr:glucosyl transferase [Ignavibacteriales bacterium]